jgi:4'-phosphopantetheinyl transferase
MARLHGILSDFESQRASQFVFEEDRIRFVQAHGFLRITLASYLDVAPELLTFAYSSQGKPRLHPGFFDPRLQFNLSHARDLAVVAVTLDNSVGVDVERIHAMADFEGIARHFFSAAEVKELLMLVGEFRLAGFFRCWTCKEAYLKAIGEGLRVPLDQFRVVVDPNQPARLLSIRGDARLADEWSMCDLHVTGGHTGACAVHRNRATLLWKNWANLSECMAAMSDSARLQSGN